jgi:hypothetical protein
MTPLEISLDGWEICFDDSGESERYGEFPWYICDEVGMVLDDMSFKTESEAKQYLITRKNDD